jgi:Tfp pilus assembly PilM family ATPase
LGLALQGLGQARVTEHFAPAKGLLKSLGWRKQKSCWGVDIGNASLKAVCLSKGEQGLEVIDSYFAEYPEPICRKGVAAEQKQRLVVEAIETFLAEREIGDKPVWANLAASEMVNRFVRLPPVGDKQAAGLVTAEVQQRVPIAMEDLMLVQWLGKLGEEQSYGRPAIIAAAKKSAIEHRFELLGSAGLRVSGLQGDGVALANFAAFEFSNQISPNGSPNDDDANDDDANDDDANDGDGAATQWDPVDDEKTPAVAIVDCGAATTNVVIVSAEAHWIWTIETAGEEFTTALARATQSTHAVAEQLKRNPAELSQPAKHYRGVEQRQDEMRSRIEKVFRDAMTQNERFDVRETWCLGGGSLAHQWIRRLLLAAKP